MRILGFNGSPRKYGNTAKLLYLALKAAEEEGAETKVFHLYDYR
ncbi:MAG: flavodoxin family protein, partial [Candidatus Verstraetearchaeota archaeon]|nr:flavodoxin family protein [Candidatus Verstraetearchaeota archaeon]